MRVIRWLPILLISFVGCKRDAASVEPVRFGVVPAVSVEKSNELYGPLVSEIGKTLGRPVELRVAKDYEALRDDMITGEVQVALVSAYLYVSTAIVRAESKQPMHVLAQERRPADDQYVGAFVVKKDNPAESLADCKGKTIAYVDESSSSGYHYPRMRMRALGLDPDDFFGSELLAGSHDGVIAKVKKGEADVGAVSELSTTLTGLRVIERTDPIPEDAIVNVEGLTDADRVKLKNFLLKAHTNPVLSNLFIARSIERYVPARIEVYEAQRAR